MSDKKIRILICHTCESVEELPWYEGPSERDDTLNYRASFHRFPDGNAHFGNLATVKEDDWAKKTVRREIVKKISAMNSPGKAEGLGQSYYDVKSNFQQDALSCWKQHGRTLNCDDFMSDKKRLYPDTRAERKDAGLSVKERPVTWLCNFCPMQSVATTKMRRDRGDYDPKPGDK